MSPPPRTRRVVVLAALGVLAALAAFGGREVHERRQRDIRRLADLRAMQHALERFRAEHGQYPPPLDPVITTRGGVDSCAWYALDGLASTGLHPVREDPLFTGGYVHPGPDQWCYYYRKGPDDGYALYMRLELPWGSRHRCGARDRYRAEIADFDVCAVVPPHPLEAVPLRVSLRTAHFGTALLVAALVAAAAIAVRSLVERRRPLPPTPATHDRLAASIVLVSTVGLFLVATRGLLRWYYANYLPHYDSVGVYMYLSRIVWMVRDGVFDTALTYVRHAYLGWLAPVFAFVAAPFISAHPAGFQPLNAACLGVFLAAIGSAGRLMGASPARAAAVSLVALLPDALMNWDGGYQDFRRDSQFLPLLGAAYFLLLAQLWQPDRWRGLGLGVVTGLAVWSRGEAGVYLAAILGPLAVAGAVVRGWRTIASAVIVPGIVAAVVAAPFLGSALPSTLARRAALMRANSEGVSVWASIAYYWDVPFHLWATAAPNPGATPLTFALGFAQLIILAGLSVAVFGRSAGRAVDRRRALGLVLAGAWALVVTMLIICVGVRWAPGYGWAGYPPFYPALLGPFSWAAAALLWLTDDRAPGRVVARWGAVGLMGAVSVGLVAARMWLRAPVFPEPVDVARRIVELVRKGPPSPRVAVLTHDRINVDTLKFLDAQTGFDPAREIVPFYWRLPNGEYVDFASRLPEDAPADRYNRSLYSQLREYADFVIVNRDTDSYALPPNPWNFFLFRHGKPVVEALLGDARFEPIMSYALTSDGTRRDFVVLRNRRRAAVSAAGGSLPVPAPPAIHPGSPSPR